MKIVAIIIVFVFQFFIGYSQSILLQDRNRASFATISYQPLKIDLHLQTALLDTSGILTYTPFDNIKFTFKAGFNYRNIEKEDFYQVVGYEYRIKYYINKTYRIILKDQSISIDSHFYSLGLQIKF